MSDCCRTDHHIHTAPCPHCAKTGPVVGHEPVQPHLSEATAGPWQHCATPDCPVVFHIGNETVSADQLRTQVGHKARHKPTPVCFCFSHTADDITADLQAHNGTSTIKANIKTSVADRFCACEHLNPNGKCCLPDVHRTVKATTDPSAAVPVPA